ncbi:MAG: hypothetical protein HOV79_00280 [Hamadaea sp.]|nr:hypothetical protein [Hamadaea sp.]
MPIRFQVDPDFYDHPKVLGLSDAAVALWTKAGSYSAAKHTDGFIAEHVLATLSKTPREAAEELRRHRLWHKARGGYRFHEWDDRNLTKERIEADRKADRERKKRDRAAKNNSANDPQPPVDNGSHSTGTYGTPQARGQNVRPDSDRTPSGIPTDANRNPSSSVSVSVSESVSVSGTGRGHPPNAAAGPEPLGPRPPETCTTHQDDPDPPACRRCKTAREHAEAWDTANQLAEAERQRTAPDCDHHPGKPAHNCGLCRSERIAAE